MPTPRQAPDPIFTRYWPRTAKTKAGATGRMVTTDLAAGRVNSQVVRYKMSRTVRGACLSPGISGLRGA